MDGGDERGVFVLSRELHKRLPQHFINNSAYGQKGGVGGDGSCGETAALETRPGGDQGNPGALPPAVT